MSSATASGIQTVFHVSPAERADVMTGAMIRATTAGRIPMNIADMTLLFFIMSGVRKPAIASMIRNDGNIVPAAATIPPFMPRSLSPTAVAILTARIPGSDCAMARRSRKSSFSIQLCRSTISRSIIEIIAHPPPNVNAPILRKLTNNCQYISLLGFLVHPAPHVPDIGNDKWYENRCVAHGRKCEFRR